MMTTNKTDQVLVFLQDYIAQHGYPPLRAEIAKAVGISLPTVNEALIQLQHMGKLQRTNRFVRTIRLVEELQQ
jgi:SOS-response transcriptional repressor LexA